MNDERDGAGNESADGRTGPCGDGPDPAELAELLRRATKAAVPHVMAAGREILAAMQAFADNFGESDGDAEDDSDGDAGRTHIPVD